MNNQIDHTVRNIKSLRQVKQVKRALAAAALAFTGLLFTPAATKAQQAFSYSQYMNNLTPLNPAYSLLDQNGNVNALLRKQYVGIEGAPTTFIFDGAIPLGNSGTSTAGLVVMNDNFSIEHLTEINAFYAKGIRLAKNSFLGVSLTAGFKSYNANYSQLDSNDPQFRQDVRQSTPNFGFGVMYYSDHYYVGVSVPELTISNLGNASVRNDVDFKNHYNLAGAYLFNQGDGFEIKPAFLAQYTQGIPVIANFSTTFYVKNAFGFGAGYRTSNEFVGILSFMTPVFRLGYSYEFGGSSSNVGQFKNATHEVTLSYRFGKNLSLPKLL